MKINTTQLMFSFCFLIYLFGCAFEQASTDEEMDINAAKDELTVATDFRVGIQLVDTSENLKGDWEYTAMYEGTSGTSTSSWACDDNCYDPDGARLDLEADTADDVRHKDIRICLQASDGRRNHSEVGVACCTPWASQGGGASGVATDSNGYDPDTYRVQIQTRSWPTNNADQARDIRLRIRAYDSGEGYGTWSNYTPWASSGGGITSWAKDKNGYDPDGFEIEMNVIETDFWSFCSPTHKCQHGFGDCDSNNDCVSGAICVQNVGNVYGYLNNSIDVCVD